ncbi:hypothetical protein GMAR_ORF136 [Golden Marseillevirus]|uniref:hypothetical protein n=1 Tax=Golden Marseillevirus TaxID=1720526 RepID=UPI000877ADFE|nr:hypothetical protein GMAR_ORF136 [Golden Marseillevirus]ALX27510.1 hypothetical protein GMAR_ORF136 [Golden Marseillevirus]
MQSLDELSKLLEAMVDISRKNISTGQRLYKRINKESQKLCSGMEDPEKAARYLLQTTSELWEDSEKVLSAHKEFQIFLLTNEKPKDKENFLMQAWKGDLYGKKGAAAFKKLCKSLVETQAFLEQPYDEIISQLL